MHRRGFVRLHHVGLILLIFSLIISSWASVPGVEGTGGSFGGGDGSAGDPYVIEDIWDLQNMSHDPSANYTLANNIDAFDTVNWNSGAGFLPVGTNITPFVGSLDGRNHTISGLFIYRPTTRSVGLLGYIQQGCRVKDVGLVDVNVTGGSSTGPLMGFFDQGSLSGSYSSGNVTGTISATGGLVGYTTRGTVDRCYSTADVRGTNTTRRYGGVGGLIGYTHEGIVTRSYATGDVTGMCDYVGGLIGGTSATVDQCYATGDVIGAKNFTGGLIGDHDNADVSNCYATGNVTGDRFVGGLCGGTWGRTVSDSYATGDVSGRDVVGGFSGREATRITSNCYSTGNVTGNTSVGGFVGYFDHRGWIPNCHYNVDDVLINGDHHLTIGGLFDAQYDDWFGSNLSLNISDYNDTLVPVVGLSKTYDVSSIQGLVDLQGFAGFEDYTFRLAADIDLSTAPGLYIPYIAAEFDGRGYNISNLHLDMPFASCLGMFGSTMVNTVRNLGVIDCYVVGADKVGGIVGSMSGELVSRSFVTGTVVGINEVGGLAGYGTGTESYASVNVTGVTLVGGFAGHLTNGRSHDYPENAYATGTVTGDESVGGFAGRNGVWLHYCYSTGRVTGNKYVGGLTGEWGASAIGCFWDVETSGQNESMRGTGLTTAEMKRRSTFTDADWDFNSVWFIVDGVTYPLLRWQDRESPMADAGSDLTVDEDAWVTFNGSGSSDDLGIADYEWTFFDRGPKTLRGAVRTYQFTDPAVYTVTLKVTDIIGKTDVDSFTITVNDATAPVADAGPDVSVDEGTLVTFAGGRSSDNVGIVNFTWTFIDGAPVTLYGAAPTYMFENPGTYNVTLNVTDLADHWTTDTMTVMVNDTTSPVADAGHDQTVDEDTLVTFDGIMSRDNVGVVNWTWTFKYKSVFPEDTPIVLYGETTLFMFGEPGTYRITLTVTDAAGNSHRDHMNVTVNDVTAPFAFFDLPPQIGLGRSVGLDGDASTDNVEVTGYRWTIEGPDGAEHIEGMEVSFHFDILGVFAVTLNVTDAAGNWGTSSKTVTVLDDMEPEADAGVNIISSMDEPITFDGSGSSDNVGIVEWTWSFEYDGARVSLEGNTASFTFELPGLYNIILTTKDAAGNSAQDDFEVMIFDIEGPKAMVREDASIEQNASLVLDGSNSTDNVGIVSYRWTIDGPDGPVEMDGKMVTYKFTTPGWYNVTLLVTDAAGNEDDALFIVEVTPPETSNGKGGGGNAEGYTLYIIIVIVVAIVIVGLVVYLKKGR